MLCLSLKISTETIKFLGIKIFQKSKLSKNVMIKNCSLIIIILIQKKIFFEIFMPVKIDIENQNFAILSGSIDLRKKKILQFFWHQKKIFFNLVAFSNFGEIKELDDIFITALAKVAI